MMSAVVIRPDTHVLKCQANYGFVLAEQLDDSASGAVGVKADCRRGRCGPGAGSLQLWATMPSRQPAAVKTTA